MSDTVLDDSGDKILWKEKLEQGIANMLDCEEFAAWCRAQGRLFTNAYSLNNAIMVYLQSENATYTCGYEKWKEFGRQVKQGAKGIYIFTPRFAFEAGPKGSLASAIRKSCAAQMQKDKSLPYGTFKLGQSNVTFLMYKNNLYDIKMGEKTIAAHLTPEQLRKFIDSNIIGKIPVGYGATTVFDISDVTDKVDTLWVSPKKCTEKEMLLDEMGEPIRNSRGQVKILNSDERRNRFKEELTWEIEPQDEERLNILYDVLKAILRARNIPFQEKKKEEDKVLERGAKGYFHRPDEENINGYVVISSEEYLLGKVSCLLHEMAHARLHVDLEKTAKEMGKEELSRQEKEIQAEAVAYMVGSTFGLETNHNSFHYLANWSDGRDLKALEESMNIIYQESQSLIREIREELHVRGLSMRMEPLEIAPLEKWEKQKMVIRMKQFYLETIENNQMNQGTALEKYKRFQKEGRTLPPCEQERLVLTYKMDEKIAGLNQKINEFEEATTRGAENKLYGKIQAAMKQIDEMGAQMQALSEEITMAPKEFIDPEDIQKHYRANALSVLSYMREQGAEELSGLSDCELKYIAVSGYIDKNYVQYIGKEDEKFLRLCVERLNAYKSILSKNQAAVEIIQSEVPELPAGTIGHPKEINAILKEAEKRVRQQKAKAEADTEFHPYEKCNLTVFAYINKDLMMSLETHLDIGDGEQDDLKHHLTQLCDSSIKLDILDKFVKSLQERRGKSVVCLDMEKEVSGKGGIGVPSKPMKDWLMEVVNKSTREEIQDREKGNSLEMR